MSAGSRFCALARPNALSLSLCTRRHQSQWQPLFHPALVPCAVPLLTRVRVANASDRPRGPTGHPGLTPPPPGRPATG
jgi:hypothetical protein